MVTAMVVVIVPATLRRVRGMLVKVVPSLSPAA
jgi:hypothetical protein